MRKGIRVRLLRHGASTSALKDGSGVRLWIPLLFFFRGTAQGDSQHYKVKSFNSFVNFITINIIIFNGAEPGHQSKLATDPGCHGNRRILGGSVFCLVWWSVTKSDITPSTNDLFTYPKHSWMQYTACMMFIIIINRQSVDLITWHHLHVQYSAKFVCKLEHTLTEKKRMEITTKRIWIFTLYVPYVQNPACPVISSTFVYPNAPENAPKTNSNTLSIMPADPYGHKLHNLSSQGSWPFLLNSLFISYFKFKGYISHFYVNDVIFISVYLYVLFSMYLLLLKWIKRTNERKLGN